MLRRNQKRLRRQAARSRRIQLEKLEQRQLLAANPLGVTPMDTGEFLLGTVGVTPVFFESNGQIDPQTQNWTAEEIDQALAKVTEGVDWWSDMLDTLDTVHTLDFVIDDTFAVDPVETPYEPIDRSSTAFNRYVGDFVTSLGYGDANSIEDAVRRFNHDQRTKLGTDWAFTIFVVDSSDDPDGLFASGGSFAAAFAYAGGLFLVTPSTRPASTIAHEMGHVFWARDEYSTGGSWTDQRGYYNAQNLNAADNATPGFQQEISIMRGGVPLNAAFANHVSPESTLAMVGWRDSDGDGVFDLADVPLSLEAEGYFDAGSSLYHFSGVASAVPLANQNSEGPQSDITLNRISQLQYSLDSGPWIVASEPDQQVVEFDVALTLNQPFSTIHWRAIDLATGMVSPVVEGTSTLPALSASSLSGVAFLDENFDGHRNVGESTLASTQVVIRHADGSPLFGGAVDAADYPEGRIPAELPGVTLSADGIVFDSQVGAFDSQDAGNQPVFHALDLQRDKWIDRWSSKVAMEASFDQTVGQVRIDAIGLDAASYVRLEAYDAGGQMLHRVTSEAIAAGEQATVEISDSLGRIASIRAYGHAGTSVALNNLDFGSDDHVVTGDGGAWRVQNLPDGSYLVEVTSESLVHQFDDASIWVDVVDGASSLTVSGARSVDSPRHNVSMPEDVNRDGSVTSRDALVIINDISRYGSRVLQAGETDGLAIDVSNDGAVSALDALLVINYLGREDGGAGELVQENGSAADQTAEQQSASSRQMFNSAGGTTPDESIDRRAADTTDQSLIGREPVSRKIQDFASIPNSFVTQTNPTQDEKPQSAVETEKSIDPIPTEISEPFG